MKNLFRGYNKLILGFNTFLPEGEGEPSRLSQYSSLSSVINPSLYLLRVRTGTVVRTACTAGYKIELTAEEQAFNHPGQEVIMAPTAAASSMPAAAPSATLGGQTPSTGNLLGQGQGQGQGPAGLGAPAGMVYTTSNPQLQGYYGNPNSGPQGQGLGQGQVPNSQGQGHQGLGHQQQQQQQQQNQQQLQQQASQGQGQQQQQQPGAGNNNNNNQQQQVAPGAGPAQAPPNGNGNGPVGPSAQQQQQQPGQMQQAHAIHYVTKIRNRFSTEPDTYR